MKYDIFISYRREGGYDTAKHINDLLVRDGYRVSFDIDTLRNGDFDVQLLERIEECKDFILIVDKHAFDRTTDPTSDPQKDWLRCELAHALKHKKNIIPVFLSGVNGFPEGLPYDVVGVIYKNGPEYNKYYFNDFYKQLCSRFLKSHGRKFRLTLSSILSIFLISIIGLGSYEYVNEDIVYVDPLTPETTTEQMLTDYIVETLCDITDSLKVEDSVFIYNQWCSEAQQGKIDALLYLGLSNFIGYGCDKNIKNAVNWFEQSVKQDNEIAQYILGVCYDRAIGVERNYDKAMELCHQSAMKGIVEAQYDYSVYCANKNNMKEYHEWLYMAANQEYAPAQYDWAIALSYNPNTMNDAVIWLEEAANQNFVKAQLYLATQVYRSGNKKWQDIPKSIEILEKLCERNNPIAQYSLGIAYNRGFGVDINDSIAFGLVEQSAEQGYAPALADLGKLYYEGTYFFDRDYTKAMELLLRADKQGFAFAQFYIGMMYENGWGVKKSMYKANKWYRKANKQGVNKQSFQQYQQQTNQRLLDYIEGNH